MWWGQEIPEWSAVADKYSTVVTSGHNAEKAKTIIPNRRFKNKILQTGFVKSYFDFPGKKCNYLKKILCEIPHNFNKYGKKCTLIWFLQKYSDENIVYQVISFDLLSTMYKIMFVHTFSNH